MLAIVSKLKRKLKKTDTEERCGLILADGSVFQTDNVHSNPVNGFRIPGADLLEHESEMVGTWHTHPGKTAVFSQEDYFGFLAWPDLTHFIVGADGIRAYRADGDIIREVSLASD